MGWIDRLNDWLAHLAAWLFAATGAMLTYEVLARYLFNAPTTWAAEISQLFLIWGTYLGVSRALHRREHIRIAVLDQFLPKQARRALDALSVVLIGGFAAVVLYFGSGIAWDSLERGRSTGTMLNIPNWWSEAVIPLAFSLLLFQCGSELLRLARGEVPEQHGDGLH